VQKFIKTVLAAGFGGGIITAAHQLLDPSQCAAFLNAHTAGVGAVASLVTAAALWVKSPGQTSGNAQ
jgi:hypothetical protein